MSILEKRRNQGCRGNFNFHSHSNLVIFSIYEFISVFLFFLFIICLSLFVIQTLLNACNPTIIALV